ncbi:MAG: cell wall metabolism sensor histidine kinase WalK [Eubacteriaceae bacterium]|nr:cell wall metabolism sensor histidine kinase WalK [Eubacteriaceae bacterium]
MLNRIRLKLLFTNTLLLFGVVLIIVLVVYISMNMNIILSTDLEMVNSAVQLKKYLPTFEGESDPSLSSELSSFRSLLSNSAMSLCIWDENYRLLKYENQIPDTKNLQSIAKLIFCRDTREVKALYVHNEDFFIYSLDNYRILSFATANDSGRLRTLQIISNMDIKNNFSKRLLNTLALTSITGVLASFLIGYFMASRAMVPIEDSIKRQNEFVADASHELRTPVTIVRTNLDVVMGSTDESVESQMQWLENAYHETERMEKLIYDLLSLAKADTNSSSQFSFKLLSLENAISASIDRMKDIASSKNIVIDCQKGADIWLHGDADKLEQLFAIILDNAVAYSPVGSSINVAYIRTKQNLALITVRDQGIGLEPGESEKIFERFYRTDKARSRAEGGTGLGLAIAKWIVESHMGEIYAQGAKNQGTTIFIELPAVDAPAS